MTKVFPLECGLRWMGLKCSGLGTPDESHRVLFMVDSDRWGSKQTPPWRKTILDSECPVERRGGQPARARGRTRGRIMGP